MKDEGTPTSHSSHRRHHSRTMSHSHPLSRQQSPAIDLIPAPTSSGIITLTTTTTVLADLSKRPREYINVAQRKEMRKHGAIRDTSYWNTLLIAARKSRGPYLCPSTRTYHVDRASKLYWSGYSDTVEPETPDASIPTVTVGQDGATENGAPGSTVEANAAEQGANGDAGAAPYRTGTPTPAPVNASAPASAGGVPSTPTGPEIKEESTASHPNGSLTASNGSLNNVVNSTPNQNSNLTSPTLNPALMNRPLPNRGNALMSPTQQGSVFAHQLSNPAMGQGMQQSQSSQPQQHQQHQQQQTQQQQQQQQHQQSQQQQPHPQLQLQQQQQLQHQQQLQQQQQQLQQQQLQQAGQGINPMMVSQSMGGMSAGMMAGGFVSPDSLMQQMPGGSMPGQMSMGMPQGYVNMGQMHPQLMQHLQAQQQQNPQQMYAQQQHLLQQQFLQQQQAQQQAQQQQMMQGQQDFQGPPRPKGRPRRSKDSQVMLGSPTLNHARTPSVSWADQQQPHQQ
ncbi:hypothetical protein EC991_005122 [Linnemannia zychae]|nr:hypothetical protein EC991_005122 [Linnemannia zychae]